jgi:PAS domain-containing protein
VLGASLGVNLRVERQSVVDSALAEARMAHQALTLAGAAETSAVRNIGGRGYLSLMRSLVVEQGCLQCHAGQGYKVGDVLGSLGVDAPLAPLLAAQRPRMLSMLASYGLIWLIGLGVLALVMRALQRHSRQTSESEAKSGDLFDSVPVAYHEVDRDGVIRRVNRAQCALLGYEAGEMLGRPVWEFVAEADREASREAIRREMSRGTTPETRGAPLLPARRR